MRLLFRHPEVLGASRRASKDDGRGAGAVVLRGSLRSHLRMTVNERAISFSRRAFAPEVLVMLQESCLERT
jgi:hypothetical protein